LASKAPPPTWSKPICGNSGISSVLNEVSSEGLDIGDPAVGCTERDEGCILEMVCDIEDDAARKLTELIVKRLEPGP
jgi:hypothetical protein